MVTEVVISTSVAGGGRGGGDAGKGVCAWRTWVGDWGGLEKDGEEVCWLKCNGGSTLTLIVRWWRESACGVGGKLAVQPKSGCR